MHRCHCYTEKALTLYVCKASWSVSIKEPCAWMPVYQCATHTHQIMKVSIA